MKKSIVLFLSFCMLVSLVACGGNNSEKSNSGAHEEKDIESGESLETLQLGESISSDIVDLTINKAALSFFASSFSNDFTAPIESDDGGIFSTNKGHTFVCMNFVIKNNDRGSLDVGGGFADWPMAWKVKYKGEEYSLNGFDLNDPNGYSGGLRLNESLLGNSDASMIKGDTTNYIMDAGETLYVQTLGIAGFEAEDLKDEFELMVSIPSSSGEYVKATYKIY